MKLVSSLNEINYGSYDEGLDWNIQNYRIYSNGKSITGKKFQALLNHSLRVNIFAPKLQAELEFLKSKDILRILLIGYDIERDTYLEKSWVLSAKHFSWEGSPEKYLLQGEGLGLDLLVECESSGALHLHFSYFDHYHIHFVSHIHRADRKPLRNVNPFNLNSWSFSEKHAMLACNSMELTLDGNSYSQHPSFSSGFNLSYEWFGGYLPSVTKELRCQFWQPLNSETHKPETEEESLDAMISTLTSNNQLSNEQPRWDNWRQATMQLPNTAGTWKPELAGSLLMMGHDSCSSESAIWVESKLRYRLPRIVPNFGRSEQLQQVAKPFLRFSKWFSPSSNYILPDLEWKISAGEHLQLNFQPFSISDAPQLVFPLTQTQRIYGLFYGKLLDQFNDVLPIQKALGFIDYRQVQWRKH